MIKQEHRLFLTTFLKNPRSVGSVVPSSKTLARAIADQVAQEEDGYIVELGAGTGMLTQGLLKRIKPERLVVIERDEKLYHLLVKRFPGVKIIHGDVVHLRALLKAHHIHRVSAIISGIPLLSIPRQVRMAILTEAFAVLPPHGAVTQFTYGLKSPVPKKQCYALNIKAAPVKRIWRNFPPARIWRFEAA